MYAERFDGKSIILFEKALSSQLAKDAEQAEQNYQSITGQYNTLKTNYNFNKLNINGQYNINDEVVNEYGLIGIITKTNHNFSEMAYLYNTNLTIKIDNITGKIISKDQNNNLIIGELTNHNNININDYVYSLYNTYIGKVIKINYEVLDTTILVETPKPRNINYVAVISR